MARYTVRPRAWRDLNREADNLEERAGLETAARFFDSALRTFAELAEMPKMGHRCGFSRRSLRRMRRWPVKGFENWAIFYLPRRDGAEVVNIYHGARDLDALFI